jgi:hypothetical protein
MTILTRRTHPWFVPCLVFAALACAAFADRAYALCSPGEVKSCIVNSQPGTQTCGDNGFYGPCTPIVPPAPPVPAAPRVNSRGANGRSLTLLWSDSTMWASAVYQLQYQVGASWAPVATLTSTPAAFVHAGLQPDTRYCYRVEVTASTGVRRSTPTCRFTTDGTGRKAARVQLELHTGDVGDAGTDDSIQVVLSEASNTGMNSTWVDYGRDDFERGDTFTYDLNLDEIPLLSDITRIRITKDGTDGWCLADFRLLVNEIPVYAEDFHHLSGGCHWLDGNDGHQPTYEVAHAQLRAHALWQAYNEPQRLDLDFSGFPLISATLHIPRAETEQRLEGMIGHLLHGSPGHWGDRHNRAYVEADPATAPARQAVDLDLEATVPGWFDPELDVNFDLHYEAECSPDQTLALVHVTTENVHVNVDFDWFTEFLSFLLFPPCTIADCVTQLEDYIADRVEAGFEPIVQSQRQSLPAGTLCLSAEAVVHASADVDLVFHLLAPTQPPPSPAPTPSPSPTPPPNDDPTPPPDDDPSPLPCGDRASTASPTLARCRR